jgi:hypothetical protein
MKITYLLSTLFLLSALSLSAQDEQTLFNSTDIRLSGIWGSIDHNYNFFEDEFAYARGFNIGIEVSRSIYVGFARNSFRQEPATGPDGQRLDLHYDGLLVGYAPNSKRLLHPRFQFFAGSGVATVKNVGDDDVYVLKPSAGLELNVFQWFRVGLEAGYRFVTYDNIRDYESDFSSPYGNIALRFGLSWGD